MGGIYSNTVFAGSIAVVGLAILFVILHPQRVEKREDEEEEEEAQNVPAMVVVAPNGGTVRIAMPGAQTDTNAGAFANAVFAGSATCPTGNGVTGVEASTEGTKADAALCPKADVAEETPQESALPKEKKYILSEAQLDSLENQIRKIVEKRKLFLNPNLNREMLMEKLDVNRSYLSEVFTRRLGPLDQYVNQLRMEYAVRYAAEHPDAKLTEVARSSGFGSMTTFYRTKAGYEATKSQQINR